MKHSPQPPTQGQFLYVGPPPGQQSIHVIIQNQPNDIITWSLNGFTWRGSQEQFKRQFKQTG
jgi:hypothetical protein